MQVLKFGGTSVANSDSINNCVKIITEASKKDKTIVVFSAIAGCTDMLIQSAKFAQNKDNNYKNILEEVKSRHLDIINEIIPPEFRDKPTETTLKLIDELSNIHEGVTLIEELSPSTMDLVMSYGEMLSTSIISRKLNASGVNNLQTDSRKLIKTYKQAARNNVLYNDTIRNISEFINKTKARVYVVPGFISSDIHCKTTTLGRGGSDYTASLFAAACKARILEIWTDVNGMMTADPSIVNEARTIKNLSYKEALELSHFGAKVVYPPTIQPAVREGIPIAVKNTFDPYGSCTVIERNPPDNEGLIKGISSSKKIALLSLEGNDMVGIPGYSARLFSALARHRINIILITQASSVHTMCVAIDQNDSERAGEAADHEFAYEISLGKVNPVIIENDYSIITLVGDDMKNQSGTSGKMFDSLGRGGINIRAIAQGSSERNISAIVSVKEREEAVKIIHDNFFGNTPCKKVYIFIAGYGKVGRELHTLISERKQAIKEENNTELIVSGVCTSSRSIINKSGIEQTSDPYKSGEKSDIHSFIKDILSVAATKPVFVDCTAEAEVAALYNVLLNKGISVVTCNKIAPSSPFDIWKELKQTACKNQCSLFYETTAGAALPILKTIEQLKDSGEEITEVQTILSGTLNYLFSNYDGNSSFASLVNDAMEKGYAEPDPATDLSGMDVIRKTIIIARQCGFKAEISDVISEPAVPSKLFNFKKNEFMKQIEKSEPSFLERFNNAVKENKKTRYTAIIKNGSYTVKPQAITQDNPLYHVNGTNNSVTITTSNYPSGITITGAGAGARVTAGGILNDIIKSSL